MATRNEEQAMGRALVRAARDPRVAEIEAEGMDDGRVFLHLRAGFRFAAPYACRTKSVGSAADILRFLSLIESVPQPTKEST